MSEKPILFRAAVPQFRVADLVATAEYYRDALGFALKGYFGDPPVYTGVYRGGAIIHLGLARGATRATQPQTGLGYNAYIYVDNVNSLADEYKARGVKIIEGPVDRAYRCRELIIHDCNGLVLCFGQSLSEAPAA